MNIHEAANVASRVLGEYAGLLARLEAQGGERYTKTLAEIQEAKAILDTQYPPPLGISIVEYVNITERLG